VRVHLPKDATRSGRVDSEFSSEKSREKEKDHATFDDQGGLHHLRRHRFGQHPGSKPACAAQPATDRRSAIDAARAGAAIVHCHVRDPETGVPSRRLDLYREVTDRIRDAEVDVVLNLTAGMGGDITFGSTEAPFR
jgi:hypothetical protein